MVLTVAARTAPPAAGWRRGSAARRLAPLLPALATVLLLAAPIAPGDVNAAGKVAPADAASAVLVLTCAVRLVRARRQPVLTARAAALLGAPLIGFAASAVTSPAPGLGAAGFVRYAQVFVLVPVAVVLSLRDRRDAGVLAGTVVVLALLQGAVGTWQYATGTGASYMGRDVRAVGTFGPSDIMGMATVVAYGLVIAAGYALAPEGRARARWVGPAAAVCAGALLVPLAVSFSRGTWIATAVACAAVIPLAGRRRAGRVLAVLGMCAVLLVGGFGAGSRLIGDRVASIAAVTDAPDHSVTDRYALWSAALSMWREHPALGVGLKRFPAERDAHAPLALSSASDTEGAGQSFVREPLLSPHNMYLLALAEQGLVGCALLTGSWAGLLALAATRLAPTRRRSPMSSRPGVGLAAVGLLVWTCVDFLYADIGGPATVLTAVVLGLAAWWALHPEEGREQGPADGRGR
ncbi:O-antigen ligase [Streptomyces sp. HPF1205]|uniref:O-antigen ligase family protein n=1 Tax=Streptomyces sp. HPF1205 TaxID=2873262 RepID=UPI001CED7665|nr:O-antigen ligase family protein [Streptomyces sp. HPF1205]